MFHCSAQSVTTSARHPSPSLWDADSYAILHPRNKRSMKRDKADMGIDMGLIIAIASVFIAFFSMILSMYSYRVTRKDSSYSDIDTQYVELLKLSLEEPDFRNYSKTANFYKLDNDDEFKKKYTIYAFICWNLVETIYDQQKDKKGRFKLSETWIPVMFEENRLHYSWFKHNIRLFKGDFQRFVTEELNDIEIINGNISDLKSLYSNFEKAFPKDERKSNAHLEMLMSKNHYRLLLAKHKLFDEIIGYALIYTLEDPKMLWLDYMATEEKYQNAGYGTLLFNKIIECEGTGKSGIFIEVEIPDEKDHNKERRIKFYERLGAKRLGNKYKLPTNEGGLEMFLYYKPITNDSLLPSDIIKKSIGSAYNYIHTDVCSRDEIMRTFIATVKDEYLDR